jgi:hypothetical protein
VVLRNLHSSIDEIAVGYHQIRRYAILVADVFFIASMVVCGLAGLSNNGTNDSIVLLTSVTGPISISYGSEVGLVSSMDVWWSEMAYIPFDNHGSP